MASKMKLLLSTAQDTFLSADKEEKIIEKLENIERVTDNIERVTENWLGEKVDDVERDVREILVKVNNIADSTAQKSDTNENDTESQSSLSHTFGKCCNRAVEHAVDRLDKVQANEKDCNLMIFGYWEEKSDYGEEVSDVLNHLDIVNTVHDVTIVRNKISQLDEKVIIRLAFDNPKPVNSALARARRLKSFSKHKVYLAKDLDYQERLELRKCVLQLRKNIKEQPNTYWTIRGKQVVSLGPKKVRKNSKEM